MSYANSFLIEIDPDVWAVVGPRRPKMVDIIHAGSRDECEALKLRFEEAVQQHEANIRSIFADTNSGNK